MRDECEPAIFELVVVDGVSECIGLRGLYLDYHPELPILRKAESNSGETPCGHRKMRCMQSNATGNGRAHRGEPRRIR